MSEAGTGEGATAMASVDTGALRYALSSLGGGVRQILGEELHETPRAELIQALQGSFQAEELKSALEDAFQFSLQCMVIGLKQAWLLMETGGEIDYCEAFGEHVRAPFVEESGLEGRQFIDFLDGFFLDYDTALDACEPVLGLTQLEDAALFEHLLSAGAEAQGADELAAQASQGIYAGFIATGLEEEHPIVRLGCWRELLADSLHFHFTDLARSHPTWSRYLEHLDEESLAREEMRVIVSGDAEAKRKVSVVKDLVARNDRYREEFGPIIANREWLFDIADRLEDIEENVESDLLRGKTIAAQDLPQIVAAGVGKVHARLGTSAVARLSDALQQPAAPLVDVLRRARRDFRRCHWGGENYGQASLELAGALLPLQNPRAAERYYREAKAFGADVGTCEHGLYFIELLTGQYGVALGHLKAASEADPERFATFDMAKHAPQSILGAGGGGPTFLGEDEQGNRVVVKTLWDPVSAADPRPSLQPLRQVHQLQSQGLRGLPQLVHLGVHHREFPYIVTEYVEGDDLESFREVRGGDVPPHMVGMLGAEIARVLKRLHDVGVVHRNLKPGNVRVGAGEEGLSITLLDACIPNVLLAAPGRVPGVRRLLMWARTGRVVAESFANYTAPEVVKGGLAAADPLADVYSLGAVLYRLATGAPPRKPDAEALDPSLRGVIMRCLERAPEQRPQNLDEVIQALSALAEGGGAAPAAPAAEADPFAEPAGDPFAEPGGAQPSGAQPSVGADPFAQPAADPFAQPAADPFAQPSNEAADPFAQPSADPFAQPAADPFAQPSNEAADPFAQPAGGAPDPFAQPAADPFAQPSNEAADPFAQPAGGAPDPFAQPAADPFAQQGGAPDPFAQPAGAADPFAQPAGGAPDPFAQPAGGAPDPFAEDPFAQPAGGVDPFAAPPGHDPFAQPAGGAPDPFADAGDPFATPAGAPDPFAQPVGSAPDPFAVDDQLDPLEDPFRAPTVMQPGPGGEEDEDAMDPSEALAMLEAMMGGGGGGEKASTRSAGGGDPFAGQASADPFAGRSDGEDPFAMAAGADPFAGTGGADPFAAADGADPFAAASGGADPFAQAANTNLSFSVDDADDDIPDLAVPDEDPAPAPKPKPKPKRAEEATHGVVISGLSLKSKKDAAVQIIMKIKGISEDEARDMCRSPVVPVLKKVTQSEAEAAEEQFKAAKINVRVTSKKRRR